MQGMQKVSMDCAEPSFQSSLDQENGPQNESPSCFIIIHNVSKRHNIGTLARSAAAFGVKQVRPQAAHRNRLLVQPETQNPVETIQNSDELTVCVTYPFLKFEFASQLKKEASMQDRCMKVSRSFFSNGLFSGWC